MLARTVFDKLIEGYWHDKAVPIFTILYLELKVKPRQGIRRLNAKLK
jgi:hypothetical protein